MALAADGGTAMVDRPNILPALYSVEAFPLLASHGYRGMLYRVFVHLPQRDAR